MVDQNLTEIDKRFKESFLKRTRNLILVSFLKLISILPFWILYGISDFLYLLIRFIVRYRKKVITDNIRYSFPEKSPREVKQIRNKFYRYFCDLMMETVKLHSVSGKTMDEHISFKGLEAIEKLNEKGQSTIVLAVHHNNWEWCSFLQTKVKILGLLVYNPMRGNHAIEKFVTHSRNKWGSICVPVHKTGREIIKYQKQGIPTGLLLVADQTPPANSKFWTIFLNRETPFFSGPEKIAIKGNMPVFFQHIRKIKRGKYEVELIELFSETKDVESSDILLKYVKHLEDLIREEPENYLWSHRRWKHTRPEGIELTL